MLGPTKVLKNSLRPKGLAWTVRCALATKNELYRGFEHILTGPGYRFILAAMSRADSLRNLGKAIFERNIATYVKDNKKS